MRKLRVLIFIVLLGVLAIFSGKNFFQRAWDGKNRINIVVITSRVFIFSLDPSEKRGVILSFPQKTFLEAIHGYGDYSLEAIYKLGEQEGYGGGGFLAESIQENLGIPIDAYVLISDSELLRGKTELNSKPKDFILRCFKESLRNGRTNLTRKDLLLLWFKTRKVRRDKINLIDLEKIDTTEKITFPDGTESFKINPQKFKKIAPEFFKDPKIRQENLEIAVLNSTSYPGLATRAASLIENIGGRVVGVGEFENEKLKMKNEKCQIRSKKEFKKSYTLEKLVKVFGCRWQEESLGGYRGDLVLIIGEGYWKKLKEK